MTLDDLRDLGYHVDMDDADVVAVRGYGVALFFHRTEQSLIDSLGDAKAHAGRQLQWRRAHSPRVDALGL